MRRTRPLALVVGALAALSAAACGDDDSDDASSEQPFIEMVEVTDVPEEPPAPGDQLAIGDTARLVVERTTPQEFATTIIDVIEGDEGYWDRFDNADDFAGEVPYFIVVQHELLTEREGAVIWPTIGAQLDDGEVTLGLETTVANASVGGSSCPLMLGPEEDPDTQDLTCVVVPGPPGEAPSPAWQGPLSGGMFVGDPDDPYVDDPVLWG